MKKILRLNNVFGKRAIVLNGEAITQTNSLPTKGEFGKIYYNKSDNKYYVVSDTEDGVSEYIELGTGSDSNSGDIEVASIYSPTNNVYNLQANKYYLLGTLTVDNTVLADPVNPNIKLTGFSTDGVAKSYIGRFTAGADNLNFLFSTDNGSVHICDEDADIDIIQGHTYEFNVLYDTVFIKDITYTSQIVPAG